MVSNNNYRSYRVIFGSHFDKVLYKLQKENKDILGKIRKQIEKILKEPLTGKPLRNVLKNKRRVHIGPFVLVY